MLSEQPEKRAGTLKEQLESITPALQEMRLRKEERLNQFRAVQEEIQKITAEIAGNSEDVSSNIVINENDLSLKKFEEFEAQLQHLYNEKVLHSNLWFIIQPLPMAAILNIFILLLLFTSEEWKTSESGEIHRHNPQLVHNLGEGFLRNHQRSSPKLEWSVWNVRKHKWQYLD